VKSGKIKKPIVAWAIGTCAKMFTTEVQFGPAGSMANSDLDTADAKNGAMRDAGLQVGTGVGSYQEAGHFRLDYLR
jgi:ATP citrate (pro-S)-lyase